MAGGQGKVAFGLRHFCILTRNSFKKKELNGVANEPDNFIMLVILNVNPLLINNSVIDPYGRQ